jgi:hypothetical protein
LPSETSRQERKSLTSTGSISFWHQGRRGGRGWDFSASADLAGDSLVYGRGGRDWDFSVSADLAGECLVYRRGGRGWDFSASADLAGECLVYGEVAEAGISVPVPTLQVNV